MKQQQPQLLLHSLSLSLFSPNGINCRSGENDESARRRRPCTGSTRTRTHKRAMRRPRNCSQSFSSYLKPREERNKRGEEEEEKGIIIIIIIAIIVIDS